MTSPLGGIVPVGVGAVSGVAGATTGVPQAQNASSAAAQRSAAAHAHAGPVVAPIAALHTPSDVDVLTPGAVHAEEGSEGEEDDGLFAGGDEEEEESGDDAMEDVTASGPATDGAATNGVKRKLVEEEDYD